MYDTCTTTGATTGLTLRPATEGDRAPLVEMLDRCTEETRRRRFAGLLRQWPTAFLDDCLAGVPERHDVLVLAARQSPGVRICGLASAAAVAVRPDGDEAEISMLIEDAWQHSGMGDVLLDALLERAWSRGVRRVVFQVDCEQRWVAQWAFRHLSDLRSRIDRGTLQVEARLLGPGRPEAC